MPRGPDAEDAAPELSAVADGERAARRRLDAEEPEVREERLRVAEPLLRPSVRLVRLSPLVAAPPLFGGDAAAATGDVLCALCPRSVRERRVHEGAAR